MQSWLSCKQAMLYFFTAGYFMQQGEICPVDLSSRPFLPTTSRAIARLRGHVQRNTRPSGYPKNYVNDQI